MIRMYRGLAVSTWDVWRNDTDDWPDRAFYRGVVERFGEPVLDLACATGRLLLDGLADGIDIEGLDASADMLEVVRDKAAARGLPVPTLHHQGIEAVSLARRYRTILASSSALQLLTGPEEAEAALARLVDHLEPGGAVVGSFDFGWVEGEPLDSGWVLLFERQRDDGGPDPVVDPGTPPPRRTGVGRRTALRGGAGRRHDRVGPQVQDPRRPLVHPGPGRRPLPVGRTGRHGGHQRVSTDPATPDDWLFCVLGVRPDGT